MIDQLSEDMRKLVLLGIGAAALTAEKSKKMVDELVKKGGVERRTRKGPQRRAQTSCTGKS